MERLETGLSSKFKKKTISSICCVAIKIFIYYTKNSGGRGEEIKKKTSLAHFYHRKYFRKNDDGDPRRGGEKLKLYTHTYIRVHHHIIYIARTSSFFFFFFFFKNPSTCECVQNIWTSKDLFFFFCGLKARYYEKKNKIK